MTTSISRRDWLKRSSMAAAILPISSWYNPIAEDYINEKRGAPGALRLNANENPYGPSEAAKKAIMESLSEANRYPRDHMDKLREAVAKKENVTPKHILLTAGSTELLGLTGLVYGLDKGELVSCHPTFDFLLVYAERIGCTWARTPVTDKFEIDLNAMSNATSKNTKLIFICNPNNPTGLEIPTAQLRSFVDAHAGKYPIYLDEAYIELSPEGRNSSMVGLVDQYPNLIIGRTFSKVHGLAGMRIGYAVAHPDTIAKLSNLHIGRSISVSVPGAAAALASLEDAAFEAMSRQKIIEGRNIVCNAFDDWGVRYLQSATNFVYFNNAKFGTEPVKAMEAENIIIRSYPGVPDWTRVSIGTVEEMQRFIGASRKYLV